MAACDAIGSLTSLVVSRGIARCVGSFYWADCKLQILDEVKEITNTNCNYDEVPGDLFMAAARHLHVTPAAVISN